MEEIKKVIYKTIDGMEFLNKELALTHENTCLAEKIKKLQQQANCVNKAFNHSSIKGYKEELVSYVPEMSGIYMLVNPQDNYKKYIGKAENLKIRYKQFLSDGRYAGNKMEDARQTLEPWKWNYCILEICPHENLLERETFFCNLFNTITDGYNSIQPLVTPVISNCNRKYNKKVKQAFKTYQNRVKQKHIKNGYQENTIVNITQEEFYNAYQDMIDFVGERESLCVNDMLLRLEKINNEEITISDIAFLPLSLACLIQRRPLKQKKSHYYSGVGKFEDKWRLIGDSVFVEKYLCRENSFETEEEAYSEYLKCKVKQIKDRAQGFQNKLTPEVFNCFMNLDEKLVEKLICY